MSYVNTWGFLREETWKQMFQQTLPEIDWNMVKASLQNACDFPIGCCYYLTHLSVLLSCL